MKTVGIFPNIDKDKDLAVTCEISAWLTSRAVNAIVYKGDGESEAFFHDADFIIVLGGDGTLLRASHSASVYSTPLIGINLGTLGYLADVERHEAFEALEKVLDGRCKFEKRMMLRAELNGAELTTAAALNDVCLSRGVFSKMATVGLTVSGEYIDSYRGDGLIVATPTGSTAYSLSAGGPILKPDAEMIAVTPICPHMIYARPVVVSAADSVELCVTDGNDCALEMDGRHVKTLQTGDVVRVTRSPFDTTVIKTADKSFFDILRKKMGAGIQC